MLYNVFAVYLDTSQIPLTVLARARNRQFIMYPPKPSTQDILVGAGRGHSGTRARGQPLLVPIVDTPSLLSLFDTFASCPMPDDLLHVGQ